MSYKTNRAHRAAFFISPVATSEARARIMLVGLLFLRRAFAALRTILAGMGVIGSGTLHIRDFLSVYRPSSFQHELQTARRITSTPNYRRCCHANRYRAARDHSGITERVGILFGRSGSFLRHGRFWLSSQASKHTKHLCLARKCCPLGRRHRIVGGATIVNCRNL